MTGASRYATWLSKPGNAEKRKSWQVARRNRLNAELAELKSAPCADCGQSYPPYVMHYDHRDPTTKVGDVSQLARQSIAKRDAELPKCDLICSNCHAERTHQRASV